MRKVYLLSFLVLFACKKDPIQYSLSVRAVPQEGGLVNPSVGIYNAGETVSIINVPNDYFIFKGWSGDWIGTNSQIVITMDSDKNIVASDNLGELPGI